MPEEPIHQPHDKLFKASFSDPVNAAAFLRREVPANLAESINWEELRLQPGSFIDSQFRHTQSDLLFTAPLADSSCLLYFLFEHQTSPDPHMALRLLSYMVRIWEEWIKNNPGVRIPIILPVVLAQNSQTWNISPQFASLLDIPIEFAESLQSSIPDFNFRFIQLANLPFPALHGTPTGIMTLRVMKAERLNELLNNFVWDESLILQLPQHIRERLLLYIIHGGIDIEHFYRKVDTITNLELQSTAMSLAEQLLQRGHQKGHQEGHQQGRVEGLQSSVIEALEIRFESIPFGLAEAIRRIQEEAHLHLLHKTAIRSATLEEFTKQL